MKTLVTGSTGFIGGHLTRALVAAGREVRCLVRPFSDTSSLLDTPAIELVCADLEDGESIRTCLRDVDVVYHVAVDYSRPSVEPVRALTEGARTAKLRRFVFVSSIAVTGPADGGQAVTEETPCAPRNDYARAKVAGEEAVREAHARDGLPAVILRPTAVYGPGEVNFWLPLFRGVAGGRLPLFGDGSNRLNLCFVENLVEGALLAETSDRAVGETYVISDGQPYPFDEVVRMMARACGAPSPRRRIPGRYAAPVAQVLDYLWRLELMEPIIPFLSANVRQWMADYACSVDKATRELGYPARVGLQEGIERTVAWYRQNGYLHSTEPWCEGILDAPPVVEAAGRWRRSLAAAGHAALIAGRVGALTWKLPPRLSRKMRRRWGWVRA